MLQQFDLARQYYDYILTTPGEVRFMKCLYISMGGPLEIKIATFLPSPHAPGAAFASKLCRRVRPIDVTAIGIGGPTNATPPQCHRFFINAGTWSAVLTVRLHGDGTTDRLRHASAGPSLYASQALATS
jgi:hypothetical protein